MKQASNCTVGLFVLLFLCITTARAEPLRVGHYSFPPYFTPLTAEKGVWAIEVERILDGIGQDFVFQHYPPRRLVRYMIEGRTDVTVAAKHIAVDDHVHYSAKPIGHIRLNVYHKQDHPQVKDVLELKGKRVIVIRGYAYDKRILTLRDPANNITLIEAQDHEQAVERLLSGNGDYLLDYDQPVAVAIENLRVPRGELDVDTISGYPVFLMVSKQTANSQVLIDEIDRFMAQNQGAQ